VIDSGEGRVRKAVERSGCVGLMDWKTAVTSWLYAGAGKLSLTGRALLISEVWCFWSCRSRPKGLRTVGRPEVVVKAGRGEFPKGRGVRDHHQP
jgi:hypothetical protein